LKDEAIYRRLFRTALLIRLVEERIIALYPSDKIQSPVHLSIGQEAVAVGVCDGLRPDDLVFATYRSHGFYIAKGGRLDAMFAELYGRKGGISGGKAGSMHLTAPEVGLMGSSAVVASTIPHAVGAALSFKRRGVNRLAVAVFGDGATEEGVYHESLNFAALMKVPVLFLCENNRYSELTPIREMVRNERLTDRATALGMPATRIDGNDPAVVRETVADLAEAAREGGGPAFVELTTQRLVGHYIGDVQQYRTKEELEADGLVEPITIATAKLTESGVDTDAIEREVREEVETAAQQAIADPVAYVSKVKEHLYA